MLLLYKYSSFNSLKYAFVKTFISDILLLLKFNISKFLNLTFSNTLMSEISLLNKYSSFNSLKFTFSKTFIFDILFLPKYNTFNFLNSTFSKMFISVIQLE